MQQFAIASSQTFLLVPRYITKTFLQFIKINFFFLFNVFFAGATTTSQAVMAAQQNKSSKKINYDALKGVFDADGSFATPSAPSAHHSNASGAAGGASSASSGSAFDTMGTAGLLGNGNQAYLDSLLGLSQPSSAVAGAYGAGASSGSGFSKDVRNTVLGSSIAKTSQRGQRRMLNPGNAVGTGSTRSAKLGPAVTSGSASAAGIPAAPTAGSSSSSSNVPSAVAAANAAAAATSAAYNEDLGDADEGEEDQLLYEGGNGDDDGYDDYEDEYY